MGFFPLITKLLPRSNLLATEHGRVEDSLKSGGILMRKIKIRSSPSKFFACTSETLLLRLTRYEVPPPRTGLRVDRRRFVQQYCKEVVVCKLVDHPNVMSIEGVAAKSFKFGFSMVSQWMENGNLLEYMTKYPGANRLDLVGLAHDDLVLCSQVCS